MMVRMMMIVVIRMVMTMMVIVVMKMVMVMMKSVGAGEFLLVGGGGLVVGGT